MEIFQAVIEQKKPKKYTATLHYPPEYSCEASGKNPELTELKLQKQILKTLRKAYKKNSKLYFPVQINHRYLENIVLGSEIMSKKLTKVSSFDILELETYFLDADIIVDIYKIEDKPPTDDRFGVELEII